jgi:3-oxoadipate enol-lactonase
MFVTVNAHTLHVALHGRETNPAIVLLHSLGTCAEVWAAQIRSLSQSHFVVCPDLRGHGLSELSGAPLTIEVLADDVRAVIAALKLTSFHLAGISIGGMVAQLVAGALPAATRTLAVFDSSLVSLNPQMWRDRAAKVRAEGLDAIAESVVARWTTGEARQTPDGRGLAAMLARTPSEAYAAGCDALALADCRANAARLTMPTTIAVGALDEATPPTASKALAEAVTGSTLRVIDGAAHIPLFERPEAVNGILSETMARA